MPDASVVLLPFDRDVEPVRTELVGQGIVTHVPHVPEIPEGLPAAQADARRVALTAMWLNDHAVRGPVVVVGFGHDPRLFPALGLAQRAAHRLVSNWVIVDGTSPAPAQDWPDAPVLWVLTGAAPAEIAEGALSARLRGFTVLPTDDVVAAVVAAT